MAYPKLNRQFSFGAAVEATPGTAETISLTTHAIRLLGVSKPEEVYLAPNSRVEHITGTLARQAPATPAGRMYRMALSFAVRGAGSAYAYTSEASKTVPEAHPLLRAAGFSLTVAGSAGSETATYAFSDDPGTTITAQVQVGNKEYILSGAVMESLVLRCRVGEIAVFDGTLVGIATAPTEQAVETATYSSVAPAIWKGTGALAIAAYSPIAQTLDIDFGLSAAPNVSANAADGLAFMKITGRNPRVTVGCRVPSISDFDPHLYRNTVTSLALDAVIGFPQGQYGRMDVAVDAFVMEDVQQTDDGDFCNYTITGLCSTHATAECDLIFD